MVFEVVHPDGSVIVYVNPKQFQAIMRRRTSGIVLRRLPKRTHFAGRPRDETGKYVVVHDRENRVPITIPNPTTGTTIIPNEPEPEPTSDGLGAMPRTTAQSSDPPRSETQPAPSRRGGARRRPAPRATVNSQVNPGTTTRGPSDESSPSAAGLPGAESGAVFGRAMSMVELCNKLFC
ncbi:TRANSCRIPTION FACTOR NF-Y like [Carpediemonas membranifera]|uniref:TRANSCRIPTION FACTOR NF-Y like n=1 Tax=Carpediemonas membranifera TaxID=201153 RepID=A0A8J6DY34_9EUKA|nr:TRANSCRIPTION FACTOR NF-Y like [Carpediemonas membranifera]|eukprot:KAG9391449.1 TRANSCRIPTION FACTOR NF-Y like [Carpediemonas membranifera]